MRKRLISAIFFSTTVILLGDSLFEGTLPEIVVHGDREPVSMVSKTTVDSTATGQYPDIGPALESLSDLDVKIGGKGESNMYIRGTGQERIKLLIDGVPVYESYSGLFDLGMIGTAQVSSIDVIKGGSSSLYGANTMGGVVNVVTSIPTRPGLFASIGDYSTSVLRGSMGGQVGGWDVGGYAGWTHSNGFALSSDFDPENTVTGIATPYGEDGGLRDLSYYNKVHAGAMAGFERGSTRLDLRARLDDATKGCTIESSRYWEFDLWRQWQAAAYIEQEIGDRLSMTGNLFFQSHVDQIVDDAEKTVELGGRSWFDRSRYDNYSAGGRLLSRFKLSEGHILRSAMEFQRDNSLQKEYNAKNRMGEVIVPGWGDQVEYRADNVSISAEDFISPLSWLGITVGVGVNGFVPRLAEDAPVQKAAWEVDPQLSASFYLSDRHSFFLSSARKTRFPRLKELYSNLAGGNPELSAEKAINLDAGWKGNLTDRTALDISLFRSDIKDLIDRTKDEENNWIYVNTAQAVMQGVEADFRLNNPRWGGSLGMTWLSAEDGNGKTLDYRPEFKVNADAIVNLPLFIKVNAGGQLVYGMIETLDDVQERMPSVFLLHCGISHSFHMTWQPFTLGLVADNLLDVDYREGGGPMPGRSIRMYLSF